MGMLRPLLVYSESFPDSTAGAVHRAPSDYPSGKEGDVLIVSQPKGRCRFMKRAFIPNRRGLPAQA
jgi:hypothetical protein